MRAVSAYVRVHSAGFCACIAAHVVAAHGGLVLRCHCCTSQPAACAEPLSCTRPPTLPPAFAIA
eukprot:2681419-Alexandrium_andersonii.AAC.1